MKSKLASLIKFLLLLAIASGLFFFAFRGMKFDNVLREIRHANFYWILLLLFISFMALCSRAYRWKLLIEPLGYSPALKNTFHALMIGYLANLAFPRLGEVSRCGILNKAESIPFGSLIGTVIVERAVDVISLLVCTILTAVVEYERLWNFIRVYIINPTAIKFKSASHSPLFIAGIAVGVVLVFAIVIYLKKRSTEKKDKSRSFNFIKQVVSGLKSVIQLKHPWQFTFHSLLIWILYFLGAYVSFFALPATAGLGFGAALFMLTLGGVAMSAPVQGGIGLYHLLVAQGLMLYSIAYLHGLSFATLIHASQMAFTVLLGCISLFFVFMKKNHNRRKSTQSIIEKQII